MSSSWNDTDIEPEIVTPVELAKHQIDYLQKKGFNITPWDDSATNIQEEINKRRDEYIQQKNKLF